MRVEVISVISMWRHVRLPAAWFPFFLVLLIGVLVMALVFLLVFLLEFNFETSPAWQVGVYYLMLGLLFFVTFVVGFHQPQGFGVRYRRTMLVLAGLTPLVIFVLGWVLGGAYLGPRNLAGNPDSPQTVVFITSIIDAIAGVST